MLKYIGLAKKVVHIKGKALFSLFRKGQYFIYGNYENSRLEKAAENTTK